ncbi:MAG: NAD(P)/FAD-dependent oxidoreductase [Acidimicrobiia bacterium]|nr:NAD(P)/FAD-dependent oxidoreductase [Acidimicrobiia bacterium]
MSHCRPHQVPSRRHFDAIVVGAGSGGLTAAVGLGRFGRQVLLVEREHMGGDCTNTGCIPSKTLLHLSRQRPTAEAVTGDGSAVLKQVRHRRDQLREHELEEFSGAEGVTFVYGRARLNAADTVAITSGDGSTWTARADDIILATGSSPRRLPITGLPDDRYLTNLELFELAEPPRHLAVVGGGAVGLEMALAFRRLGAAVTVIEAEDSILPTTLPQVGTMLTEVLVQSGIEVRTGHRAAGYEPSSETLKLQCSRGSHSPGHPSLPSLPGIAGVDKVLVAVGRVPNTTGLGLEEIGVGTDEAGRVVVDERGRTSVPHLWAVGDMTTEGGTTHYASMWGRRVIQSIVYPRLPIGAEPLRPAVVFTEPEVATIGQQSRSTPPDVVRITVDGSEIDRTYTDEVGRSMLIVDVRPPTGEVIGATAVSPRAGELISTFSLAMKSGIAFHRWYGTVIPYPTYAEMITVAVEKYLRELSGDVVGHTGRFLAGLGSRWWSRLS